MDGDEPEAWLVSAFRSWGEKALFLGLIAGLIAWGYLDVGPRGQVVPGHLERHRTDFTVYTTAASAFLDGRDPYAVTNPRGWSYLYPPLFALTLAPIARLDPVAQVSVWFAVSLAAGFGVFSESRRILRLVVAGKGSSEGLTLWVATCAGLTVLLPTLECLQRGQVGIVLLYALLLGLRLVLEGRAVWAFLLAGLVTSWPVAVKLIPALPAGFLAWQWSVLALRPGRARGDLARAGGLGLGVAVGLALFLVVVPAAVLGWGPNLRHLQTWTRKVVTNPDAGNEAKFHIDSTSNQSFTNAAHRLAIAVRRPRPDDPAPMLLKFARNPAEIRWALDRADADRRKADTTTRSLVLAAQAVMALLLLVIGSTPRRADPADQAAGFGLACVGMLLLSPVAWTHYYMMMIPAILAVPVLLDRAGRPVAARAFAAVPAALVWAHFLARPVVGPAGLLGLGTASWFFAAASYVVASRTREMATAHETEADEIHAPLGRPRLRRVDSTPTATAVRRAHSSPPKGRSRATKSRNP